jgi:hypothetical protein
VVCVPVHLLSAAATSPILLLAFDRPDLLEQVLLSLLDQQPAVDPARVHLFLDGAYCPYRDALVADPVAVDRSALVFRRLFPAGQVHRAPHNLGVAFNYDRAERFAFDEGQAPLAYFLEDDMVLSPFYLATLDRLGALALTEPRVAYVAAYGDHRLSVAEERARLRELQPMRHLWAYALTRRHWLERQPILAPYLDLLRGSNYRDRPHQAILEHWWRIGGGATVSSQDGAKAVACQLLGRLRLVTVAVLGRYIGEVGLHFSPAEFRAAGFHLTQCYPAEAALHDLKLPDEAGLTALLAAEQARALECRGVAPVLRLNWPAQPLPLEAEALVTLLYRTLLGREPDAAGLEVHVRQLQSGFFSPAQMVQCFLESAEFKEVHATIPLPELAMASPG